MAQCPADVVGYWPLDGDGTEVVNGFPGTLVGTASFGPGPIGQALELAGDGSYLDAGAHPELSSIGGSQLSVVGWIRREPDGPAGDTDAAILSARTLCGFPPPPEPAGLGNYQFYGGLGPNLYFSVWGPETVPGDGFSKQETAFFTFASAPLSTWTHVAAAYNGVSVKYYVDGVLIHDAPATGPAGTISDDLRNVQIGWDSCSSYWTGGIDDLSVWSVALTDTQISDLYQRGLAGVSSCASPADLIAQLVGDVIGLNLQKGITNSLDAKLDSALNALEDLNTNNDVAAVNSLEAFINAVQAQRGNQIPEADAVDLIASAQAIIDLLEAS